MTLSQWQHKINIGLMYCVLSMLSHRLRCLRVFTINRKWKKIKRLKNDRENRDIVYSRYMDLNHDHQSKFVISHSLVPNANLFVPLNMKGCICHFVKWQIHPFIYPSICHFVKCQIHPFLSKGTSCLIWVSHNQNCGSLHQFCIFFVPDIYISNFLSYDPTKWSLKHD